MARAIAARFRSSLLPEYWLPSPLHTHNTQHWLGETWSHRLTAGWVIYNLNNNYYYHYYCSYLFCPLAQGCRLNIVLSKVWLQRHIIGVKRMRKATAFPLTTATDNCWNRKVDSLGSPVINVACLPISWTSSAAQWFQVPPVSMATGQKMCQFIIFGNYLLLLLITSFNLTGTTAELNRTCRVLFRRGDSEPWMPRGAHSMQAPESTHCAYSVHMYGTVGTSAFAGHRPWSDCHPIARGSAKADLYPVHTNR